MEKEIAVAFTKDELKLIKDAIGFLEPFHDDSVAQQTAVDQCDGIFEKIEKAIEEIGC